MASLTGVSYTVMQSGGASGATGSSGDISQTVSLPSGGSITYTVSATVLSSATGSLSNTTTVTAPNGVTNIDPNSVNGSTSATDTDTLTPQADLQITKDDGQTTAVPGMGLTYTITVTNTGPSDAPGALVSDMFPASLTGVSYMVAQSGGARFSFPGQNGQASIALCNALGSGAGVSGSNS